MTPHEPDAVGLLADRIAAAVTGCPTVAALSAGPFGAVATYLPGRLVAGVAVREMEVEVRVVARYGPPLAEVAAQIRAAVAPLVADIPVHVGIDDIVLPEIRLPPEGQQS